MRKLIMMLDYTGAPRAWASGPPDKMDEIRAVARENLDKYCAKKKALGEPDLADPSKYTELVEDVPDEVGEVAKSGRAG